MGRENTGLPFSRKIQVKPERKLNLSTKWCMLQKNRPDGREWREMKVIESKTELRALVRTILDSADKTREKLQNMSAEDFLFNGKFGFLGTKWDRPDQDDDLSEQIQQSMTMLMTCYAIDWFYFDLVDFNNTSCDGTFTINDGDKNGVDLSFKGKSDLFTLEDHFTDQRKLNHKKYMQAKKRYVKFLRRRIRITTTKYFTICGCFPKEPPEKTFAFVLFSFALLKNCVIPNVNVNRRILKSPKLKVCRQFPTANMCTKREKMGSNLSAANSNRSPQRFSK